MTTGKQSTITLFFVLSVFATAGILISSLILINYNGTQQELQGWVNLLWLPLPLFFLLVDRILVRKFGPQKTNKTECYVLGIVFLLFAIHVIRLQLQH